MMTGPDLASVRKDRGLSQSELARLLGVERGTVSLWERNPRPLRPMVVLALRAALAVPAPGGPAPGGAAPLPPAP